MEKKDYVVAATDCNACSCPGNACWSFCDACGHRARRHVDGKCPLDPNEEQAHVPANRCGWDLCGEPSHRATPPGGESDD